MPNRHTSADIFAGFASMRQFVFDRLQTLFQGFNRAHGTTLILYDRDS
jgi:hypothetical protein